MPPDTPPCFVLCPIPLPPSPPQTPTVIQPALCYRWLMLRPPALWSHSVSEGGILAYGYDFSTSSWIWVLRHMLCSGLAKSASGTSKVHCTESRWFHQPNLPFNPLPEASSHPPKYVASCSRTHTSVITIVFTFLLSNHTFTNTRLLICAALLSLIL